MNNFTNAEYIQALEAVKKRLYLIQAEGQRDCI